MFRKIKNILLKIMHTDLLVRNYKASKDIDDWFRKNLENPKFKPCSNYSRVALINNKCHKINLNDRDIWISNKYYSSPTLYKGGEEVEELPYPDTTIKFFKELNKFIDSERKKIFKDI